ncbi:hypothetical protein [Nonomuraea sp. NPDC005501]|uniref:hypothetical protein n=1 Tax=Nonomuraea sp. NPDC005501 TaxID=3156884 RepID=UPI0033AA4E94
MGKDHIQSAVQKALFYLSRNQCYAPDCPRPVLQVIDCLPSVFADIAHICAEEKGGARYDSRMTREERRSFSNLILLCKGHHKLIDTEPTASDYTVEILRGWKEDREGNYMSELNRLGSLTEERLQELMLQAVSDTKQDLLAAVGDLKSVSSDTAETIRSLLLESFDRPYILDAAQLLNEAARRLGDLEYNAHMLYRAAGMLGNLEQNTNLLADSANKLRHLEDNAQALNWAASKVAHLEGNSYALSQAVDKIEWGTIREMSQRIQDASYLMQGQLEPPTTNNASALEEVARKVEIAVSALEAEKASYITGGGKLRWPSSRLDWDFLKQGFYFGVGFSALIALLVLLLVRHNS